MAFLLTFLALPSICVYAYVQWRVARRYGGVWRSLALAPALVMVPSMALAFSRTQAVSGHLPIVVACFACLYFLALFAFKSAAETLRSGQ